MKKFFSLLAFLMVVSLCSPSTYAQKITRTISIGELIGRPVDDDKSQSEGNGNCHAYYVTSNTLNVRADASASSKKVGTLYKYQTVTICGSKDHGDWVYVSTDNDGYRNDCKGYVSLKYLKEMGNDPIPASKLGQQWSLIADNELGYMDFEINGNNVTATCYVSVPRGVGWLVNDEFKTTYSNQRIMGAFYDAKTGYLAFKGMLWKIE